jgi:uncharacterized protein YkwD
MEKAEKIIFVLLIVACGFGVCFRDDIVKFYDSFASQIQDSKKAGVASISTQVSEVASMVTQSSKKLLTPPPLLSYKKIDSTGLSQSKIIAETNLQRQQNGSLPALIENTKLDEAAEAKVNDMFLNQYFEHDSPSGVDPGKLVQNYGYNYIVAGENLILGSFSSEKEVVDNWMASPGHRANILNNRYTEIGVAIIKGIYKGKTAWIGVQEFGLPLSDCVQPDVNLKSEIDSYKAQSDALTLQIDEKKNQIDDTNQYSLSYSQMVDDYNKLVGQYNSLAGQMKESVAAYNNQVNIFNSCIAGK